VVALLLAACGPAAAPAAAPAAPAGSAASAGSTAGAEWDRVLAAAKQEGTVVLLVPPAALYREAVSAFERQYPEIKLEVTGALPRDVSARLRAERDTGQYLWDVYFGGPESSNNVFKPSGYLAPLRPALLLPEITSDQAWFGGFEDGWIDREREYIYGFRGELNPLVYVNRQLVSESELNSLDQLTDPRWKGQMTWNDPRAEGAGASDAGHLVMVLGEDWFRRVMQQDPVVVRDGRQQAEWLVRGRYPIAAGINSAELTRLQREGLGANVAALVPNSEAGSRLSVSRAVALFDRAPHPNAAKVFISWLLSREGQDTYARVTGEVSRRLDITGGSERPPVSDIQYRSINKEEYQHFQAAAMTIATEVLGR
jgi:iron(III) transport system substrate-binding protein